MNKLMGLSGMKSLEQFKSLSGSAAGAAKTYSMSSRPSSDSVSSGSFANLKLTAEKLVKEQASAKTDLDLATTKLKKLTEYISALEEKLQNAFNENAKLKVKQKEDEKLWKGLESKFSSTKTLCDQLTETLQHLAGQVQEAEKDKANFEAKLAANSVALDTLHDQMQSLSLRLESSEGAVKNREKELKELSFEKEEKEKHFRDEQCRAANLIEEKDAMIKHFEATVEANRSAMDTLNLKFEELNVDLRSKEKNLEDKRIYEENLEKEKSELLSKNKDFDNKLDTALQELRKLEDFVKVLAAKLIELDEQSLTFSEKVAQLNSLYDCCFKMAHEEKDLEAQRAQMHYDKLHNQSLHVVSEKNALKLVNQELNNKIIELQKVQVLTMVQHAEECRVAEDKIQKLESEIETLLSKRTEMQFLITESEEKISALSESSRLSENKMQDLLSRYTSLESEKTDSTEKLQAEIHKKSEEIDVLQKEIGKHEQNVDSMEKQMSQLQNTLDEKEQIILQLNVRVKELEDQMAEIQALFVEAESKLTETRKQYDLMLESKQLELSRHLKDISQKNDQAINDIRRRYEVEKLESVNIEKEKGDRAVQEVERKCEQKLADCKEESRQNLKHIQDEHAALIIRIKQEHDMKEMNIRSNHSEELKHFQLQAENELREKTMLLRKEHEVQLGALRCQLEDECRKLQEDLDLQKSREDRQRALLQLQWKVMGDKPQEDQEVDSKKNHSISSRKMRSSDRGRRSQPAMVDEEDEEKDSPYVKGTQTPVSSLLKKVDKGNAGSARNIPKHSRKVTHHEYEVETSNGRTITKRRKTKSTVMFADPRKHRDKETPKDKTPRASVKGTKGASHPPPSSNIGDLFSEGSLNPYADDPYAFD